MKRSKDEGGTSITRRGWFGALAAVAALVAGTRRKRSEPVVDKQRRRRFWIGHT
jgi:hypothetical protein